MPKVSVIVPVYKAEDFLRRCVESVREQSFSDWELLLIEDGSPDESGALCDALAAEDARIRVFHKPNGGVSSARNVGLDEAAGTYVAFLDSDDWFLPGFLEKLVGLAEEHGADSAGCAHLNVSESGETQPERGALGAGVYGKEEILRGVVDRLMTDRTGRPGEVLNGFIWRFLYTREIIEANHIRFEGAYLEDEIFLIEYFCRAEKLAMTEEPLYGYLLNSASATHRYMKDYMQVYERFLERKTALAERLGLGERCPGWRESTNWAGLLIAVGNEYAKSNPASWREKQRRVEEIARRPEMAEAMEKLHPTGQGRNKQIVTELLRRRQFGLLTLLYRVKNR
ncbi:MAG: glycosyltransferase [Oscillospiraceae bacterium]